MENWSIIVMAHKEWQSVDQEKQRRLRALPAVHEVISRLEYEAEFGPFLTNGRQLTRLTRVVRQVLQKARENVNRNYSDSFDEFESSLWTWLKSQLLQELKSP